MSLAGEFEREVRSHIGDVVEDLVPAEEPDYRELRRLFPPTKRQTRSERIAEAAGFGTAREDRGNPAARVRRRSFERSLQRYETSYRGQGPRGGRQGRRPSSRVGGLGPQLVAVARRRQRELATLRTVRQVVRAMGRFGTRSEVTAVRIRNSKDRRQRVIVTPVFILPEVYDEVGWPEEGASPRSAGGWHELGARYVSAFCIAYGIEGAGLDEEGDEDEVQLEFEIGSEHRGDALAYTGGNQ